MPFKPKLQIHSLFRLPPASGGACLFSFAGVVPVDVLAPVRDVITLSAAHLQRGDASLARLTRAAFGRGHRLGRT
jgi:hypothetical protein